MESNRNLSGDLKALSSGLKTLSLEMKKLQVEFKAFHPPQRSPGDRTSADSDKYEAKYAADSPGEESGDDARVWKLYNKLGGESDHDMIRRWEGILDGLTIYVGWPFLSLLSTIITLFAVGTVLGSRRSNSSRGL